MISAIDFQIIRKWAPILSSRQRGPSRTRVPQPDSSTPPKIPFFTSDDTHPTFHKMVIFINVRHWVVFGLVLLTIFIPIAIFRI
ncbi:hypothetical protein JOC48_000616 [Aquibacillus albus]|uniref:Uncharacterized protein n=1 Tax=Aquibacillus albus TaxID=1168171 RepID=A0ABS2MWH3_9BACI|nr:hypothetical protein [Aquibacillus albus]